jgi:AcrR family transcriptional regulator
MSPPPDPRTTRSRDAILNAARTLLLCDGPAGVTHQRVAAQAGVGRATVYRHWPRPEQLLLDVMASVDLPFFREPATPVRPWLATQLRRLADELTLPNVSAVAAALMQGAVWDPHIAHRRDQLIATITHRLQAALELAGMNDELHRPVDPHDASALLIGPILYRTVLQTRTVPGELIDQILDSIGTWETPSRPDPHCSNPK